jgi:hypothetical protein
LALQLRNWLNLARQVQAEQFPVDGSFVKCKDKPGDVDAAVLLSEGLNRLIAQRNDAAIELSALLDARQANDWFAANTDRD